MKLIALDIDGVLNSARFLRDNPGSFDRTDWIHMLDPVACSYLARIVEHTDAKIVISSSWRYAKHYHVIADLLAQRGVIVDVLGQTPIMSRGPVDPATGISLEYARGHEIQAWIDAWHQKPDALVILDDCSDMAHLLPRLVKTTLESGLQHEHSERAIAMLNEGT